MRPLGCFVRLIPLPGLEYKSQVEGTIRNVQSQIKTIEQFLKDEGL